MQPESSKTSSKWGIAVISFDFFSVFNWPKTIPFFAAQALIPITLNNHPFYYASSIARNSIFFQEFYHRTSSTL